MNCAAVWFSHGFLLKKRELQGGLGPKMAEIHQDH